jgi:WD40 repeat protein
MSPVPLHARIVEVIADLGEGSRPRYRYGSGCIVAGRTVLTSAHVIADALSVLIRDTTKTTHQAWIDPSFIAGSGNGSPDLALVDVEGIRTDFPPLPVAIVNRDSPGGSQIPECHAYGYPDFNERTDADGRPIRETVQSIGFIPVLSGMISGLLSLEVTSAPADLPPGVDPLDRSPWSGMSGGPVIAQGCLVGVVTGHSPRAGPSAITVTPLAALTTVQGRPLWGSGVPDPDAWWAKLGVADASQLRQLPPPRRRPPYWATAEMLRGRTEVLRDRAEELAQITAFATGDGGYRWLVGEAYAGKTSLLAHAIFPTSANTDVACYFLSRREADADSVGFLEAVVPQLAYILGEDVPSPGRHEFRSLWRRAADRAGAERRHLLLVVDGLDEDTRPTGQCSVAALLPEQVGGYVHVLVSSRPHPPIPPDTAITHPLRHAQQFRLQPFAGSQQEQALAVQEIDSLLRSNDESGIEVLGLFTAAAGPLTGVDLAGIMTTPVSSSARLRQVRRLLDEKVARSLQEAAPDGSGRYQFAHESLLDHAQSCEDLNHPDYRRRIHQWAEEWQAAGWRSPAGELTETPRYLLEAYPATLTDDPERLGRLVSDIGWVEAAIVSTGVDHVLAALRRAVAANPDDTEIPGMLRTVTRQAPNLRDSQLLAEPGYVLRQLWIQAAEVTDNALADQIRSRLRSGPGISFWPLATTSRTPRALSTELGRHEGGRSAAVLPDGRIVTAGRDSRILIWNPGTPGTSPTELGRYGDIVTYGDTVTAVAVLADGRVLTTMSSGRIYIWNPGAPGTSPTELARHQDAAATAVLPDGRIVTVARDSRILIWNPGTPGTSPTELGRFDAMVTGMVTAVAVLADSRIVTTTSNGRMLIWNPGTPGTSPTEFAHHQNAARAVMVLADDRIVTTGASRTVLVWDPQDPRAKPTELGRYNRSMSAEAALADGRVVTIMGGRVLVWDPIARENTPAKTGRRKGRTDAVAALLDGRIAATGADGKLLVWGSGAREDTGTEIAPYDYEVAAAAALSDGRIATVGHDRLLIRNPWMPESSPTEIGRHLFTVGISVAALPDGRIVTADEWIRVWDPNAPGTSTAETHCRDGGKHSVAVLPDGRIAIASSRESLYIWDPGAPEASPAKIGGRIWSVAALPDGQIATTGPDGQIHIWNSRTPGRKSRALGYHGDGVHALAVLPDGRIATTARDGGIVHIWDPRVPDCKPKALGYHGSRVHSLAVLPDGRIATAGPDGRMLIWDERKTTGPEIQVICPVREVIASPCGSARPALILCHPDGSFSLWGLTDGRRRR